MSEPTHAEESAHVEKHDHDGSEPTSPPDVTARAVEEATVDRQPEGSDDE